MAEDARGRHGAVLDFFDVGGADAADGDLDEEFMGAEARDGHGFDAQVVDAAINDGAHGLGNVRHDKLLTRIARIITNFFTVNDAARRTEGFHRREQRKRRLETTFTTSFPSFASVSGPPSISSDDTEECHSKAQVYQTLRRRNSQSDSPPKPANASVEGSGVGGFEANNLTEWHTTPSD